MSKESCEAAESLLGGGFANEKAGSGRNCFNMG